MAREAAYPLSPRHQHQGSGNNSNVAGSIFSSHVHPLTLAPTTVLDAEASISDDDVPCCICGEGDSEEGNLIVFCESCAVAVHQRMRESESCFLVLSFIHSFFFFFL
jgi:hypothetical protein